jgi:hypothetical protein
MGRNLKQIIAALPTDRQARIDARYHEMKDEVESLREKHHQEKAAIARLSRESWRRPKRV